MDDDDVDGCVGVLRKLLTVGVVGALIGSAGLIGLMVFFMINSSVSPANLCPMLGNLLTMLCVSDVDGKVLRNVCIARDEFSNELNDEFNDAVAAAAAATAAAKDDDDDVSDVDGAIGPDKTLADIGANADGFARLPSNESPPNR